MAILIANLGNSDLSVKMEVEIEGEIKEYFIPIGFDRNEPNEPNQPDKQDPLDHFEKATWDKKKRNELVRRFAKEELQEFAETKKKPDFDTGKMSFRDMTQALANAYQKDPQKWHSRIGVSRIQGIIEAALTSEFPIEKIYLFVTNQAGEHISDTVYAFSIIALWLQNCSHPLLNSWFTPEKLEGATVPQSIPAVDEDKLLDYYYQFLRELPSETVVFVSNKGGTPQMQAALKTQSIATELKAQIFLEPNLSIKNVLEGKPSTCKRVAYWRYQQNQKYHLVQQLLERWDFDGAATVLRQWRDKLQFLINHKMTDERQQLSSSREQISQVLGALDVAVACLNLDYEASLRIFNKEFKKKHVVPFRRDLENYDLVLNLYAQCKIYKELRQVTHFLARMGSFYEATQNRLIEQQGGMGYIEKQNSRYLLLVSELSQEKQLWEDFLSSYRSWLKTQGWEDRKFEEGYRWDFKRTPTLELKNRFIKRSFLQALIKKNYGNQYTKRPSLDLWSKLDFWYDQRNDIVHAAKGINENTIRRIDEERSRQSRTICTYDEILTVMAEIIRELSLDESQNSLSDNFGYYVYLDIREWVDAQLSSIDI